jgi:hypothetical protein
MWWGMPYLALALIVWLVLIAELSALARAGWLTGLALVWLVLYPMYVRATGQAPEDLAPIKESQDVRLGILRRGCLSGGPAGRRPGYSPLRPRRRNGPTTRSSPVRMSSTVCMLTST